MSFTWPIDRTCLPPLPELGEDPSEEDQAAYDVALQQRNHAEDVAVRILYNLSAQQFGLEPTKVRPKVLPRWRSFDDVALSFVPGSLVESDEPGLYKWSPGGWIASGCGCGGGCPYRSPNAIHLPGPVAPPTEDNPVVVAIDGIEVDPAEYVIEGDILYRRNNRGWPTQNLNRPLGEPGTWSVTYQRGYPPPPEVAILAGGLAKEIYLSVTGGDCRIPPTLVNTTRRGVSHSFDPSKILEAKTTGLTEVDRWLVAVNPNRLQCAPEVL